MCSVVGCDSGRRSAHRFKLPEDPERRLEWVQFLATANKQRFKESSWTEITICSEHFTDDCFENRTPSHPGKTGKVQLTLKPSGVPSLCLQSGPDEPEPNLESPKCVESCGWMQPKNVNKDLIREKAALLKMKGKCVVNEKRLLQLFRCKCPSCGCKLQMEKVTYGVLVILNQRCLQCEYRNQWKSQVNASVPTAEDQHLTGGAAAATPETQQAVPTDHTSVTGVPEIVAVVDEESDPMDEESSDQGDMDSDEDWRPVKDFFPARVLQKKPDNETEDDGEEEEEHDDYPHLAPKHSQLCTDCGMFFSRRWPHTCEHKIKPYPCNICGKRCVSEVALNRHSRIHDANYEHRCKYCHVTFKTKVDKITHEQTHVTQGKPYKCPDCSETFPTNKERKIHLEDHRGPQQLKCDICGIEFNRVRSLQRHLTVHTGVKPFKCSVCQRGFNQAGHLKSHMRLHTGERPYKCQHCDKCFNHNVSLKSHVQRYHTSSSGHERKKGKNKTVCDIVDVQENGNEKGTNSGLDNVEEEQDTKEEVQKDRADVPKKKKRSTGRPIGRPKRNAAGSLAGEMQGQCSSSKSAKVKMQKLKRRRCSDEESEDEPTDCDTSFDLTEEEEEEMSEKVTSSTSRSRRRGKNSDLDSDFDPKDSKRKRYSSQNSGKSSGKRRGRPRKNQVVEDT
ncbi:zinc finger and SCAN domain-containing protein 21-like isoform X3 [Siniperca chuatsi]|uniref:zinc finger and SCAN domain-containing protein 21-like isoform X3 n=1 Tax=Siniperca chuatsi TaxID=119488 RepID=UPI001CE1C069|nr:zinc finger and SCAN domain-containing protein 21-like isoform X3 [Siniperca chuatsi]